MVQKKNSCKGAKAQKILFGILAPLREINPSFLFQVASQCFAVKELPAFDPSGICESLIKVGNSPPIIEKILFQVKK